MCKVLELRPGTPQGTASGLGDICPSQIITSICTYSLRQNLDGRGASEDPSGTGQNGKEGHALCEQWGEGPAYPQGSRA